MKRDGGPRRAALIRYGRASHHASHTTWRPWQTGTGGPVRIVTEMTPTSPYPVLREACPTGEGCGPRAGQAVRASQVWTSHGLPERSAACQPSAHCERMGLHRRWLVPTHTPVGVFSPHSGQLGKKARRPWASGLRPLRGFRPGRLPWSTPEARSRQPAPSGSGAVV